MLILQTTNIKFIKKFNSSKSKQKFYKVTTDNVTLKNRQATNFIIYFILFYFILMNSMNTIFLKKIMNVFRPKSCELEP